MGWSVFPCSFPFWRDNGPGLRPCMRSIRFAVHILSDVFVLKHLFSLDKVFISVTLCAELVVCALTVYVTMCVYKGPDTLALVRTLLNVVAADCKTNGPVRLPSGFLPQSPYRDLRRASMVAGGLILYPTLCWGHETKFRVLISSWRQFPLWIITEIATKSCQQKWDEEKVRE